MDEPSDETMTALNTPDLVASVVQKQFDELPRKRKPVVRDNGLHEWVPLAAILAKVRDGDLKCLSLATGMKCLPSSKLPQAKGNVLHDWHAEILAISTFNRLVLGECKRLLLIYRAAKSRGASESVAAESVEEASELLQLRTESELASSSSGVQHAKEEADGEDGNLWHGQPFTFKEDVRLHMYCSEAPCGDASMELTMSSQEDATPWTIPPPTRLLASSPAPSSLSAALTPADPPTLLPGRAFFSQLGIVRRKPARGDAPPSLSKSCSDKLSLRQCTSLLSSLTSLFVSPENAYLHTLILPASQYSAEGCRRAFSADGLGETETKDKMSSRMLPLRDKRWSGGYRFQPFAVETTDHEFDFSKRAIMERASAYRQEGKTVTKPHAKITPSNQAVAWTRGGQEETTLNGVLQGHKSSPASSSLAEKGASFASRRRLWALAVEVAGLLDRGLPPLEIRAVLGAGVRKEEDETRSRETYGEVKDSPLLRARQMVKEETRRKALEGWVRNTGDEDFTLALSVPDR